MTGGKMNQIPAPASRLWEAGIRKLNTTMAIRRGSSVFPATGPALIDGDPAVALSVVASSNTIYGYDVVENDADSAATEDNDDDDDADEEEEEEDDDSAVSVTHSEQLLPSGDFYQGGVRDDLPHGSGKFLWTDGSMYEGSWRRGRASGRGKFSWPSGATYEGDLAGGYMHGHGTYIGEFGDTFAGHWANNFRHGRGTQAYANGDVYDGHWRDGRQDGHGRYIWRYGHEYIGTWKAGEMHGCGTVIWADGDRYDGAWEDAKPKGQGTFRWADGSMYIGVWWQEQESGETSAKSGVYYPPSGGPAVPMPPREPREAITKLLEELEVTEGKVASLLPSQKIVTWPGVEAVLKKPVWRPPEPEQIQGRRSSVHRMSSVSDMDNIAEAEEAPAPAQTQSQTLAGGSEDAQARAASVERAWLRATSCMRAPPKPAKKQGETISKGHKNYELMLNLQLGIRHAVGRHSAPNTLDLKSRAFDPNEKVWTRFPPEGSKHTPPHQSCDFRWKDYCPLVFRTLRKLFDVDPADYMISICGDDALRELSSPGKSGSFFYLTNDDKYMIKTMKKAEVKEELGSRTSADCSIADTGAAEDSEQNRKLPVKLGIAMQSRVENVVRNPESESPLIGDPTGEFREVVLFFGIIDILQDYDISKKLEHAYKSQLYDPNSISAVDPKQYCKRFRDFIYRAFTEDG
ncbi:hypothetical protein ACQ4PT_022185 [Festuca glaucescens]